MHSDTIGLVRALLYVVNPAYTIYKNANKDSYALMSYIRPLLFFFVLLNFPRYKTSASPLRFMLASKAFLEDTTYQ